MNYEPFTERGLAANALPSFSLKKRGRCFTNKELCLCCYKVNMWCYQVKKFCGFIADIHVIKFAWRKIDLLHKCRNVVGAWKQPWALQMWFFMSCQTKQYICLELLLTKIHYLQILLVLLLVDKCIPFKWNEN